jgi:hypothetical protein
MPVIASGNAPVIPDVQTGVGKHAELFDDTVLPVFVLVAIADEYLAHSMDSGWFLDARSGVRLRT